MAAVHYFKPTHLITCRANSGEVITFTVMLCEDYQGQGGPAYTRDEWDSATSADWEVNGQGEWNFRGAVGPHANGTVEVEAFPREGTVAWLEKVALPEAKKLVEELLAPFAARKPTEEERSFLEYKGVVLGGIAHRQAHALWRPQHRAAARAAAAKLDALAERLLTAATT